MVFALIHAQMASGAPKVWSAATHEKKVGAKVKVKEEVKKDVS